MNMHGDTQKPKPTGILKTDIAWKDHYTSLQLPYYHPSEISEVKRKLKLMGIEVVRRWMMEDGELTPKEAEKWPQSILDVTMKSPNWKEKFKRWLRSLGL